MKYKNLGKGRLIFSLLLLAAVVLSACSTPTTPPPPTNTPEPPTETPAPSPLPVDYSSLPFVDQTWYWLGTQSSSDAKIETADPSIYSIQFMADGTYNGQADCNRINGSFVADGANLTLQAGAMTLAACPPGSQSDEFLKELTAVASFLMQDGSLLLNLSQDGGTMKFGEQPVVAAPPAGTESPLSGKIWQWLRLEMSDGTTTDSPNPPAYTVEFLADGVISGQADCNTMGGTYTLDGSALTIKVTQMTMMACPEGSMADVFVQRLNETATYVIQNGALFLNLTLDSGNMVFGEEPLAVLPEPAPGEPAAQATGNVNVRSGPGANYPVFGVMPLGRVAQVIGKSQDGLWWTVSVPVAPLGQGWVSGQFVQVGNGENTPVLPAPPVPPTTQFSGPGETDPQVTMLDADYVRTGPSDQYPALGVAQAGAKGLVIGRSQDGLYWVVRIDPSLVSSGFGWVRTAFTQDKNVKDVPAIEAPPLPPTASVPTPPAGTPTGVALTALNVRSGPGTNYPILAVAPAGTVGEITGRSADNQWWQVRVANTISPDGFAWVSAGFVSATNVSNVPVVSPSTSAPSATPGAPVSPVTTPTRTSAPGSGGNYGEVKIGVTTEPVNMRAGPGNQYDSYGMIGAGTTGTIIDQNSNGTWYAFKVPTSIAADGKGWVSASYVKVSIVNPATATAMATPYNIGPTRTPGVNATSQPPVTNACKILELKPVDGTTYKPNYEFDMRVKLQNTSKSDWTVDAVDVKFIKALDDATIHTTVDVFDLPELVEPKDDISIAVDMKAPSQPGVYGETWALVQGSVTLCQWSFTFTVAK